MRASLLVSAPSPRAFPAEGPPEVAIAGRSNVGKSSLINTLTGHHGLARTSADPGRTRLLNFFAVDGPAAGGALVLVDLPGYGYAKVSRTERSAWRPLVESYLGRRAVLRAVVLLVDARRGAEDEERDLCEYATSLGRRTVVVATKVDKIPRTRRGAVLAALKSALGVAHAPLAFSSHTGEGRDELWRAIRRACRDVGSAADV